MKLAIRRIILFTQRMEAMAAFYSQVLGLRQSADEPRWKEFNAGGCRIALHGGASAPGTRPPKLAFFAADVAAVREQLRARDARLGKVKSAKDLDLCDGIDPDGNPFQISNRD